MCVGVGVGVCVRERVRTPPRACVCIYIYIYTHRFNKRSLENIATRSFTLFKRSSGKIDYKLLYKY